MAINPQLTNIVNLNELESVNALNDADIIPIGQGIYAKRATILQLAEKLGINTINQNVQDIANQIEDLNLDSVVLFTPQNLNSGQQSQVRANIGLTGFVKNVIYGSNSHTITFERENLSDQVIDLPIESLINNIAVNGNNLVLTTQEGEEIIVPLNTLLNGLASENYVNNQLQNKADAMQNAVGVGFKNGSASDYPYFYHSEGQYIPIATQNWVYQNYALNASLGNYATIRLDNLPSDLSASEKTNIKNKLGITDGATISGSTSILVSNGQYVRAALFGDVQASANNNQLTISPSAVTNAKLANVPQFTMKGRNTANTGVVSDLTASQVRSMLNVAEGATNTTIAVNGSAYSSGQYNFVGSGATSISISGNTITIFTQDNNTQFINVASNATTINITNTHKISVYMFNPDAQSFSIPNGLRDGQEIMLMAEYLNNALIGFTGNMLKISGDFEYSKLEHFSVMRFVWRDYLQKWFYLGAHSYKS